MTGDKFTEFTIQFDNKKELKKFDDKLGMDKGFIGSYDTDYDKLLIHVTYCSGDDVESSNREICRFEYEFMKNKKVSKSIFDELDRAIFKLKGMKDFEG